jgi:3-deoxy-manno-octulosonate cytidylyltransferase (CMP-KDO synthetase)
LKKILALIPARMGSSRFPGKPMTNLLNKPMIGHVYENVAKCKILTETAVATCDKVIYDYVTSIGGTAIMTSDKHDRASDRCAEALVKLENLRGLKYDAVVMIQGDEPMTNSDMIKESVTPIINDANILVTNLKGIIDSKNEFEDRNCIKVVTDLNDNALYFSREPIPTTGRGEKIEMFKQVCVISFTREFLLKYIDLPPSPLEIAESVDMMRVLENGYKVKMVPTSHKSYSIDVEEDKKRVELYLKNKN